MTAKFDTFCSGAERRRESLLDIAEKLRQAACPKLPPIQPPKRVLRVLHFKITKDGAREALIDTNDAAAVAAFFGEESEP